MDDDCLLYPTLCCPHLHDLFACACSSLLVFICFPLEFPSLGDER